VLSFDTETELIREARLAPELACLTFSDGYNADIIHHADPALYRTVRWLLEQETVTANAPFDLSVLWAKLPDLRDQIWHVVEKGVVHDVITRQKLMDLGEGVYRKVYRRLPGEETARPLYYNLSDIHARYYGIGMKKDEHRLMFGTYRQYPLEQWPKDAILYALDDARKTSLIFDQQNQYALTHPKHNLWDEAAQVRANWALTLMSCWGFATDKKQVEKVIAQIDAEMPALIKRLLEGGLVRKEKGAYKRSAKLAKKLMYAAVGDAGELTDTGYKKVKAGEMTKDEALRAGYIKIDEEWCEISNYPGLIDYYHYGQNQLLRTKLTNIRAAAVYNLPVQTQFEVLLETGRTSSSENKLISNSMALQNPPRKGGFRSCFKARDFCTLIAADYGQAELVSLAQITFALCGYSKMRDLLNAGRDLHVDFAKEIAKDEKNLILTYDEAYKLYKAKDPYMRDRRTLAKGFNFGKPGGLGAASFQSYVRKAWGVEISFEQSFTWLDHFSEMREYMKWIAGLMERGTNKRADIQQFMTGRWRGKCYFTQGCNCLDAETEALTQRGWVKGFDLHPGDKLLTKNADTGALEWQTATRVLKYPNYRGPLVEFKTKNFSAVTTPEHRWLVNTKAGEIACKTSSEIGKNGDYRIHRTGVYGGPETSAYTDDFVELVGWVLTDGSLTAKNKRLVLHQSQKANPSKVRKIDALLKRSGLHGSRRVYKHQMVRWVFNAGTPVVHLLLDLFPERILTQAFLDQLTRPQLGLLWTTMMLGDGTCKGAPYLPASAKRHQQSFTCRSKKAADAFQYLCVLVGFSSHVSWRDMSKYKPKVSANIANSPRSKGVWQVAVLKRDTVQVTNLSRKYGGSKTRTTQRREYTGETGVWCPVVANTFFVARRNGSVFITGNTLFQGLTADAAKAAMFEVSKACYTVKSSPLYGCRPVLFVHDELIVEARKEQAAEAAKELERIMVEVYQRYTPDVKITADAHLMDSWSKDAEATFDERGKLVPWQPPQDEDEKIEIGLTA
jgi:hypothetical protein